MFADSEFVDACSELDSPDVSDWELFTESHGIKIYRQYNQVTGLYSYKIYGRLKNVKPDISAKVFMDLEYRKKWDSYVNDLKEIAEEGDKKLVYWQVKFPFPLSNRDYVYSREMRELDINDRHVWVVLCKAAESAQSPPVHKVVRVTEYIESLAMRSDGQDGTDAFMKYYHNPGGSIPTWLINWAAKKGVPHFLTDMEKACDGYSDYIKKTEVQKRQ